MGNWKESALVRNHNSVVLELLLFGINKRSKIAKITAIPILDGCRAIRRLQVLGLVEVKK